MTDTTPRFGLPLLAAGQAQKEIYHNEAVTALEALVQPVAQTIGDMIPPVAPQPGQSWIIGDAPTGEWAGHAGTVATWTQSGWRFLPAVEGMTLWVTALGMAARREGSIWTVGSLAAARVMIGGVQVIGARRPAIGDPSGGDIADASARETLALVLGALRAHGLIAA